MSVKHTITTMANAVLPAFFLRTLKYNVQHTLGREHWGEQDASWYDRSFEQHDHWKQHYTQSGYYFLWTVITDRILTSGLQQVLEIGCGSGQLAALLNDQGITQYVGLDFSQKRIEQARTVCRSFSFVQADIFASDALETLDYQLVISTEFLEHVEQDLDVLQRIKPGTRFLGTVPNFPYISHVRHFRNQHEVRTRYEPVFQQLRIDSFYSDHKGTTFFLLDGVR